MTEYISGNVLIIPELRITPSIRSQLDKVALSCNQPFSMCSVYCSSGRTDYDSYVILSTKTTYPNVNAAIFGLQVYPNDVCGYMVMINFIDSAEIYEVCVDSSCRNQGVSKKMLSVLTGLAVNPIWLGVSPKNPMFEIAVRTYAGANFGSPTVVDITPHGLAIGFNVVGMTFTPGVTVRPLVVLADAVVLKNTIPCTYTLEISINAISQIISHILNESKEWGGEFLETRTTNGILLTFDTNNVVVGGNPPDYTVDLSTKTRYNWHSHPNVCYSHFNCALGWPSGADLQYVLVKSDVFVHIVVTAEGMYSIQIAPEFRKQYERLNMGCKREISDMAYYVFSEWEKIRAKGYPGQVTPMSFITSINNITLNSLIAAIPTTILPVPNFAVLFASRCGGNINMNTLMYTVGYVTMQDINTNMNNNTNLNIQVSSYGVGCPI